MQEELEKMLLSVNNKKDSQFSGEYIKNTTKKLSGDSFRDKLNNSDSFQLFNPYQEENISNFKIKNL